MLVVYVHGLWLNGWESALLRRRLSRDLGCGTRSFPYRSVSADLAANASALGEFLRKQRADILHLVGHSLGGLVILEFFNGMASKPAANELTLPPGAVVLLGCPARGSRAARNLARRPFGRWMLGRTGREALLALREPAWSGARNLGVIAGDLSIGFGRLVGPFDEPNDGTVMVSETQIAGARQHLTLHASHSALVYSDAVARHTAAFLRDGHF
jgi:pimeloyl-ACP methyl ester carboxylesterase